MGNLDGLGYRGTRVVVTGAFSGMGEATARILDELGAEVHLVDIRKPSTSHASFHQADFSDPDQVAVAGAAIRALGPIDYVFSCAGVSHTFGPLTCVLVNFIGTRQFIESILPAVKDGGGIGIIASDAGMAWQQSLAQHLELIAITDPRAARSWCEARPEALRDGYTVSKELLIVWVQQRCIALAKERGIRINCTGPCPTATPFMEATKEAIGEAFFNNYPYPLVGRAATPEEQAWPLILLTSGLNNMVTGSMLYSDQGFASGMFTGALDASSIMPQVETV